jgi:phosphate transport system permease protein
MAAVTHKLRERTFADAPGYTFRKTKDRIVRGLCFLAMALAIGPLVIVLGYIVLRGHAGLSFDFLTELPKPPLEGGGLANAIVGTLTLVALACGFGIPLGVAAGIYVAEFGQSRFGQLIRFAADVMAGIPSIVIGVFVYTLVVIPMRGPSALAGGVALGILMLPTVMRTTEELLKLVPNALREAALALGVPKWRSILRVVLRTAAPGIATGVILALARVTGETAPLIFTAGDSQYHAEGVTEPVASLTFKIYDYATSPYEERHAQAWAAALVLVTMIFVLNVSARWLVRSRVPTR